MPAPIIATLMCESVSIDALTGRLTAFNMLENIVTQGFPACLPRLVVIVLYEREENSEEFWERVSLVGPGEETLVESKSPITSYRSIHALWNIVFRNAGLYKINVAHAQSAEGPWTQCSSRSLRVVEGAHPLFEKKAAATS